MDKILVKEFLSIRSSSSGLLQCYLPNPVRGLEIHSAPAVRREFPVVSGNATLQIGCTRKSVAVNYGRRCEANLSVLEKLPSSMNCHFYRLNRIGRERAFYAETIKREMRRENLPLELKTCHSMSRESKSISLICL